MSTDTSLKLVRLVSGVIVEFACSIKYMENQLTKLN